MSRFIARAGLTWPTLLVTFIASAAMAVSVLALLAVPVLA